LWTIAALPLVQWVILLFSFVIQEGIEPLFGAQVYPGIHQGLLQLADVELAPVEVLPGAQGGGGAGGLAHHHNAFAAPNIGGLAVGGHGGGKTGGSAAGHGHIYVVYQG
jgi:hypothetical protein